jgi:stress-induced morphogen
MLPCANKTVAMGRPVSLAHPAETPSSASCDSADFSVQVVSEAFVGKVRPLDYSACVSCPTFSEKTTMHRHRMIYTALSEELKNGLHALSLNTKTQAETLKAEAHTPQGTR